MGWLGRRGGVGVGSERVPADQSEEVAISPRHAYRELCQVWVRDGREDVSYYRGSVGGAPR